MKKEEIIDILINSKSELSKYQVSKLGLFGSFIRNEQNENSDVDILIDFEKNSEVTIFDIIEIEEILTQKIKCKIDLALMSKLKKHISKHILNEVKFV